MIKGELTYPAHCDLVLLPHLKKKKVDFHWGGCEITTHPGFLVDSQGIF